MLMRFTVGKHIISIIHAMYSMVKPNDFNCTTHSVLSLYCYQTCLNILNSSSMFIMLLSRNLNVDFKKSIAQQQELKKPVWQIQLTKTVVLRNTTELDGKSCTCAAYVRCKLYFDIMGSIDKNRWRRLITAEPSWWARWKGETSNLKYTKS